MRILSNLHDLPSDQLFEALQWELVAHHGQSDFPDDVSAIIFDYTGLDAAKIACPTAA